MQLRTSTLLAWTLLLGPHSALATTVGPLTELSASPSGMRAPSVSWDGTSYVIVWEDGRNDMVSGVDLYLARLMPDGTLLDATGIALLEPSARAGNQSAPSITYSALAGTHLIVFVQPSGTAPQVHGARFLSGSGTVIEQGGLALSDGGTRPALSPHVAFATQSYLVTYQEQNGGVVTVRGRRFFPDLTPLDAGSFRLSNATTTNETNARVTGNGTDFLVAWEDDRNSAASGIDVFGRTLPDFGTVPAAAGTSLVTAPFRQSVADLVRVGPQALVVAWQDQRLGPGVDDNLWARVYSTPFSAGGGEALFQAAGNDQLRPRLAGSSQGGLVVWQDFRSGTVAFTAGARLDTNGVVLDPDGFPLLVAAANVFEHAVAKGPNADYLVIAVRDPANPRLIFRLVRDEPPAGVMTASGALTVPADGTTTAQVIFGPARGASGLPVVDGTEYTVALSSAAPIVAPPDANPIRAGHQLESVNGQLTFTLTSLAHETVTVSVASTEGSSSGTAMVVFDNVPPVVSNVLLGPPSPRSTDDLQLSYTYADVNLDPEMGTSIEWTRNAAVQSVYQNQRTVPGSATQRGDVWRARVTPRDGISAGTFVFSNSLTIGNTAPAATNLRIVPNVNVKTNTALEARYAFQDPDNDPEGPSVLRWYDRGAEVAALQNMALIPAAMVVKGQVWSFSVLPHDNYETGQVSVSSTVTVENSVPVASAGPNGTVLERRRFRFDGTASSDIDPQDRLAFRWRQLSGMPLVTLSDTASAAPSFLAPSVQASAILEFELVVSDGEADSPADRVVIEISAVPDPDGDGLDDEEEALAGSDPARADTDQDSLRDGPEVALGTSPIDEDTDDDGVRDGDEGRPTPDGTPDPGGDADGDGDKNALDWDSDGDGLADGTEQGVDRALPGTDPGAGRFVADADPRTTTDPTRADTDLDTVGDGVEDANHNGKLDPGETDPNDPTSPPLACTPGVTTCPPGTECQGGTCQRTTTPDGGLMCTPLPQTVECCQGGCAGTLVEPVCPRQGAQEQCPIGAQQCAANSCSAAPTPPPAEGCACSSGEAAPGSGALLGLALLGLLLLGRRR